ncbi:hypothetical protein [Herbaspirillum sp. CAH-3]|uniref:hypothetical protein n=1 Tax=Herbaspirillum sp. CAH-3 TaxID=2605746 RepID=UPI0012AC6FD0|nr:hypothetical protein [Herbaspirillum sp. CAH-3]MRT29779.1 hypothetical protein [Herbaspirillum sp. CAH-3]
MAKYRWPIFADYFQFIVQDEESKDDFGELWRGAPVGMMVAAGETALSFGTLRNVDVQVELRVVDEPPEIQLDECDHGVEGAFASPTGKLLALGCTENFKDASRLEIAPGSYGFIYLISGADTVQNEWEPAEDLYSVYIWPAAKRELRPVKLWTPTRASAAS